MTQWRRLIRPINVREKNKVEHITERPIPQIYQEFADFFIGQAKVELGKTGGVAPFILVGNATTKKIFGVSPSMSNNQEKDLCSLQVRGIAEQENADFVFSILDSWVLQDKYAPRADEIMEEYGSIGQSPYKQSALVFSLETVHSIWFAICPITELKKGSRKAFIGEVKFQLMDSAQGRFAGFLQAAQSQEQGAQSKPMHWYAQFFNNPAEFSI